MNDKDSRRNPQLVCAVAFFAILTHVLGLAQPSFAATSSSQQQGENTAAASTQPLWSYQVKPNTYVGVNGGGQGLNQGGGGGGYSAFGGPSSIFDAFTGLSQRQGALTSGSPFLSILPIILIAAGGLLLLLPMLTMMIASPFGGGGGPFGGGYQNYGGYPQVSGLNKRRSLGDNAGGHRGIIELIEHVSSTIEDLSRKYAPAQGANGSQQSSGSSSSSSSSGGGGGQNGPAQNVQPQAAAHRRAAKALSGSGSSNNHQQPGEVSLAANHKPATASGDEATNGLNNLVSGGSL